MPVAKKVAKKKTSVKSKSTSKASTKKAVSAKSKVKAKPAKKANASKVKSVAKKPIGKAAKVVKKVTPKAMKKSAAKIAKKTVAKKPLKSTNKKTVSKAKNTKISSKAKVTKKVLSKKPASKVTAKKSPVKKVAKTIKKVVAKKPVAKTTKKAVVKKPVKKVIAKKPEIKAPDIKKTAIKAAKILEKTAKTVEKKVTAVKTAVKEVTAKKLPTIKVVTEKPVMPKKPTKEKPLAGVIAKITEAVKPITDAISEKLAAIEPMIDFSAEVETEKENNHEATETSDKEDTKATDDEDEEEEEDFAPKLEKKPGSRFFVGTASGKASTPVVLAAQEIAERKPAFKTPQEMFKKRPAPKASETAGQKAAKAAGAKNDWRLPRVALPEHYQISLQPNLEEKTFTGSVEIDLNVTAATKVISVNAKQLEISEALISSIAATITYDKEKEFAFFTFAEPIQPGNHKLTCQFTGVLNDKLKGFYYSTWVDAHDNKHPMAVTQFESTDARRAFPCFDEPDFKATYDVTLIVPKNLTALSNGRVTKESVDDATGLKTVTFRRTMKMSTYLLAFLVGEFVSSKEVTANGIELRAWTVPGKENLTKFALEVAAYTINYFEKYFGVPYPDPDKCDFIAIPDFAAGAMENKDCITFRETALLLDEKTATQGEMERVAEVVMHELAHMWFGDLVTMRWWNGLWLNEAFATFMEMKALDSYKPEWKVWDKFGLSRVAAMRVDSLKNTHPIECPVKNPEEAQELFDVISYQKGCSVLYQIEQFIGENIFQKGINHYLTKHSYGNTETHDLWDSLEHACTESGVDIPVRKIMDNWVFTAGHPLLTLEEGGDDTTVALAQKPFMFLPDDKNHNVYQIPVTMRVEYEDGKTTIEKTLMADASKPLKVGAGYKYVVANAGGSGFYRVNYSSVLAKNLLSDAQENLSVIERFNLISDSWAGVRAGVLPTPDYLEMVKLFGEEDDVSVWSIILSSLSTLRTLTKEQTREDFKLFVKGLCEKKAKELGWDPKPHETSQTKQLRGLLLEALGTTAEDKETYEGALEHFAAWKRDKSSIDNNILPAVVNILAYHGDVSRYEEYKMLSKEAKTPQETLRFLYALAHFRHKELLAQTMASCLSDEVRTQDAPFLFITLANNELATVSAWTFLQHNWDNMIKAYPDTGVVRMCAGIIPALDEPGLEKEAVLFFAKHKVKSGDMAISQALEMLRVNVLLKQKESTRLAQYLESRVSAKSASY
jgi:puromycin-sensitive aminopeptidase